MPLYTLATVGSPWSEMAIIFAIAAIPTVLLTLVIQWVRRQPRLQAALPWFVRSLVTVSVVSLAVRGGGAIVGYLIFIVLPLSGIIGLLIGLMAAPMVSLGRRSLWAGGQIIPKIFKGSTLAAVLVFSISAHLIGRGLFEELVNLEEAGDSMLGITFHGLVLWFGVVPASLIGGIMGGILGHRPTARNKVGGST